MTEYVETVEPTMITSFTEQAPACVVDAIRTTVCGIIGMLPPQFFEVNVRSHSTSLEQLLYTHLLHGYMFRSAMIRVDLKSSLALPSAAGNSPSSPQSLLWSAGVQQDGNYAPGTQLSNVNGDVLKWHNDLGAQSVSAQVYIQQLEAEIAHLKQQQAEQTRGLLGQQENVLLNEIQDLGSDAVMLTQDAGDDVHLAFRLFVERQLGTDHRETNPLPECTANELALLLFYTMAVGYTLCSMHVSHGIASSLDVADCTDDDDDF